MPPNPLISVSKFKSKTSIFLAKRKTIAIIDEALRLWHQTSNLDNSIGVYKACRFFIKAKANDHEGHSQNRIKQAEKIAQHSLLWILECEPRIQKALVAFNKNKNKGVNYQTKDLEQGFKNERTAYLNYRKTHAPSGTEFRNPIQTGEHWDKFGADNHAAWLGIVENMTIDDYMHLDDLTDHALGVTYLKKFDRFEFMITFENGLWRDWDGNAVNTDPRDDNLAGHGGWPYAMDKYGNLFTSSPQNPKLSARQMNHSTFNAGNDVICAGHVVISQGRLVMINNDSGHYKPNQQNLSNCVNEIRNGATMNTKVLLKVKPPIVAAQVWEFPFLFFPSAGFNNGVQLP